jgi:hypothetical protein
LTFRPDNYLTIGLICLTVYLGAVLLVQGLGRIGVLHLQPQSAGAMPPAGTVATA